MTRWTSAWSKWWLFRYFGLEAWTDEERRARMAMGFISGVMAVIGIPLFGFVLELFGIERYAAVIIAAAFSILTGLIAARPVATAFLTDLVHRVDSRAAELLSRSDEPVTDDGAKMHVREHYDVRFAVVMNDKTQAELSGSAIGDIATGPRLGRRS